MTIHRRLKPRCITIPNFLAGAEQSGRAARDRGEPVTANPEHPMREGMLAAWERGWRKRDEELKAEDTDCTSGLNIGRAH